MDRDVPSGAMVVRRRDCHDVRLPPGSRPQEPPDEPYCLSLGIMLRGIRES